MGLIDVDWNPDDRELRKFGGIYLPVFLGIVGGLLHYHENVSAPPVIWAVAVVISVLSFLRPPLARPLYLLLVGVTFPIGFVMSHVLLGVIFYLVVTPIGLLLRLSGHDPMTRRFDADAKTYWEPHRPPGKVDRYFRLY